MQVKLVRLDVSALKTDALILFETEGGQRSELQKPLAALYESGELTGKLLELTLLHGIEGFAARRVLVVGAGKPEKFDPAAMRRAAAAAIRLLKGKGVADATVSLEGSLATTENVAAVAEGILVAAWEPDRLKTDRDKASKLATVSINVPASASLEMESACERGIILGEALNVTRDIAVEPPNLMTPTTMAARAVEVAKACGLSYEVLDQDRMRQLGMGALLGVAQGSAEPPAMIILQYKPEKVTAEGHLGLIGKGVTFDTGGISIKPSEGMEKMKYDMAAGAAVIGAMQAIAKLKPGVAVTGIVPAVENMPGSKAQRPGDIVTAMSGKTIEVLNTDAEGRLILADALVYARKQGCTHLVDAATLTGAIVVALGHLHVGLFSNDDAMRDRVLAACKAEGERM